jgi:hypothetical protein
MAAGNLCKVIGIITAIPQNMENFKSCVVSNEMVLNIRGDKFNGKKKHDCAGKRIFKSVSFIAKYRESI